jgi:acetyl-CoA carboxylase biotin carboxyl carrier protein
VKKTPPKSGYPRGPRDKIDRPSPSGGPMDVGLLERLVDLMADRGVTNLDLQDGDRRIQLSRGPAVAAAPVPVAPPPVAMPAPAAPATPAAPTSPAKDANLKEVTSPMVGTFYEAPSPDAEAFVKVGSKVAASSNVCIIEAMKVFNTIEAGVSGTIDQVLVKNGDAVEFGQPLFLVRPA